MPSPPSAHAITSLAPVSPTRRKAVALYLVQTNTTAGVCCGVVGRDLQGEVTTSHPKEATYDVTVTFRVAASDLEDTVARHLGSPDSLDVRIVPTPQPRMER